MSIQRYVAYGNDVVPVVEGSDMNPFVEFVTYVDHLNAIAEDREKAHKWCEFEEGYAAGVAAAREAVAALRDPIGRLYTDTHAAGVAEAIAAIDGLKEDAK